MVVTSIIVYIATASWHRNAEKNLFSYLARMICKISLNFEWRNSDIDPIIFLQVFKNELVNGRIEGFVILTLRTDNDGGEGYLVDGQPDRGHGRHNRLALPLFIVL